MSNDEWKDDVAVNKGGRLGDFKKRRGQEVDIKLSILSKV